MKQNSFFKILEHSENDARIQNNPILFSCILCTILLKLIYMLASAFHCKHFKDIGRNLEKQKHTSATMTTPVSEHDSEAARSTRPPPPSPPCRQSVPLHGSSPESPVCPCRSDCSTWPHTPEKQDAYCTYIPKYSQIALLRQFQQNQVSGNI